MSQARPGPQSSVLLQADTLAATGQALRDNLLMPAGMVPYEVARALGQPKPELLDLLTTYALVLEHDAIAGPDVREQLRPRRQQLTRMVNSVCRVAAEQLRAEARARTDADPGALCFGAAGELRTRFGRDDSALQDYTFALIFQPPGLVVPGEGLNPRRVAAMRTQALDNYVEARRATAELPAWQCLRSLVEVLPHAEGDHTVRLIVRRVVHQLAKQDPEVGRAVGARVAILQPGQQLHGVLFAAQQVYRRRAATQRLQSPVSPARGPLTPPAPPSALPRGQQTRGQHPSL